MVSDIELVLKQIGREELANLALDLGNIDSPPGREREVGEFVEAWLRQEGFKTRVVSLICPPISHTSLLPMHDSSRMLFTSSVA